VTCDRSVVFSGYGVDEHDHDGLSIDEEFSAMLVLGNNVFWDFKQVY
jgi:hypothetical protein